MCRTADSTVWWTGTNCGTNVQHSLLGYAVTTSSDRCSDIDLFYMQHPIANANFLARSEVERDHLVTMFGWRWNDTIRWGAWANY